MTDERRPALPGPGGPSLRQRAAFRLLQPAGVLLVAAAAVSYVAVIDPNEQGHYPTCPFLAMTGYQCPGCGSLRTVHAIANGNLQEAFGLNVLTVASLPVLAFFWLRWTRARALDRPVRTKVAHPAVIWVFLGVVLTFWLVRNLPWGSFLAA